MCLQSIACRFQRKVQWQAMHFGTAHSSIPGNKKMRMPSLCLCPLPAPSRIFSIALHTAVFPAPSEIASRKSHPFPMFLQPIAGIPFSAAEPRFIPAAYALPSPLTAVWFHSLRSLRHTAAFAFSSSRFESCHKSEFWFLLEKYLVSLSKSRHKKNKKRK